MNKMQETIKNTIDTKVSVSRVCRQFYDEKDFGLRYEYTVILTFNGQDYSLVFIPLEPAVGTPEYASRQAGGNDIIGFYMNPDANDLSDDRFKLCTAIQRYVGDTDFSYERQVLSAIHDYVITNVEMKRDDRHSHDDEEGETYEEGDVWLENWIYQQNGIDD